MSVLDDLIGCNRHPLADLSAHNSPYSNLRMCKQYNEQSRLALGHARLAQAEHLRPKKYGDTVLNPDRPLTGNFSTYATESTQPRYECIQIIPLHSDGSVDISYVPKSERLKILENERDELLRKDGYEPFIKGPLKIHNSSGVDAFVNGEMLKPGETKTYGIDVDQFRKDCEEIDRQSTST